MNKVIIHGNIGADPEQKFSQGGMCILKLRIATNERVKRGEQWEDHTEWHSVTVFGKRAEGLAKILNKGDKILAEGKLRTTSYDGRDGEKKWRTEIIADDVELGGRGRGGVAREEPAGSYEPASSPEVEPVDDDDIPF